MQEIKRQGVKEMGFNANGGAIGNENDAADQKNGTP